jgi:hypothetical protein
MDTSPEYIKMCEQAIEIQKVWEPKAWDYIICLEGVPDREIIVEVLSGYETDSGFYGHGIEEGDNGITSCSRGVEIKYDKSENVRIPSEMEEKHFWLPRQDQLQEMVFKIDESLKDLECDDRTRLSKKGIINFSLTDLIREFSDDLDMKYYEELTSMEQLWLAFVMERKFKKIWTGEKWEVVSVTPV